MKLEPLILPHYNFPFAGAGLPPLRKDATRLLFSPDCWVLSRFWAVPSVCPRHKALDVYDLRAVDVADGLAVAATCCGYPVSWQSERGDAVLAAYLLGIHRQALREAGFRWSDRPLHDPPPYAERWRRFQIDVDADRSTVTEDGRWVQRRPRSETERLITSDVQTCLSSQSDFAVILDDEVKH